VFCVFDKNEKKDNRVSVENVGIQHTFYLWRDRDDKMVCCKEFMWQD
jgi:hypothetical protein